MPGIKFDSGKLRWRLLPWKQVEDVVRVLMYGEKKYTQIIENKEVSGADNWKLLDDKFNRYYDAAMRHLVARFQGERNDPETGLPHLAHAVCCILFAMWDDNEQNP